MLPTALVSFGFTLVHMATPIQKQFTTLHVELNRVTAKEDFSLAHLCGRAPRMTKLRKKKERKKKYFNQI